MGSTQVDNTRDVLKEIAVIANPAAGNRGFSRNGHTLVRALEQDGWTVRVLLSSAPGECEAFARDTPTDTLVCAAGGDGTVNEVVNGLACGGRRVRLAIFPCGTGNDFAMAVGVSEDPFEVARSIVSGVFSSVDCGAVSWSDEGNKLVPGTHIVQRSRGRLFSNVVGIGMDATAARGAVRLKRWFGKSAYTLAAIATLARWPATALRLHDADSGELILEHRRGLFVAICNGPRSGGEFTLAPDASIHDGLLDYCAVESPGFIRGLRLLPGVKLGRHIHEPEVRIGRAGALSVRFESPQDVHVDGELIDRRITGLEARILPGAIDVLTGPAV